MIISNNKKKLARLTYKSSTTRQFLIKLFFIKCLLASTCLIAHAAEKTQIKDINNHQNNNYPTIELEEHKSNNTIDETHSTQLNLNNKPLSNKSEKNSDDIVQDVDMIESLATSLGADTTSPNVDDTSVVDTKSPILINNDTLKVKTSDVEELSNTSIETLIKNSRTDTKTEDDADIDSIQSLSSYQAAKYSNSFDDRITTHPMPVGRKTSGFGYRRIFSRSQFHKGVDFAAKYGTPIYAAGSGKVVISGWLRGYGRVVYIDHGDGLQTRYAHNSKLLVKKGQYVQAGQQISKMGCSGRCTGPHLHFEIRKNGKAKNPMKYLKGL